MGVQFRWPRATTKANEYFSYLTVQIVGALINLGIFSLAIFIFGPEAYPVIPLCVRSVVGCFFNFIGGSCVVFKANNQVFVKGFRTFNAEHSRIACIAQKRI